MKSDKTINQLIDEFLLEQDVKEQSRNSYRANLKQFIHFCIRTKVNVRDVRKADVIAFKSYLIRDGKAESTINFYLTTVKMFFGYLAAVGIHKEDYKGGFINIAEAVHYPKKYTGHRKKYLKPDQGSNL